MNTDAFIGHSCVTSCVTNIHLFELVFFMFSFKVHLTPKFFFGRDETLQHSHKEFDNIISILYF